MANISDSCLVYLLVRIEWKSDRRSDALEYFNLLTPPEGALFDRVGSNDSSSSQPCLLYLKLLFGREKKMYIDYGTDTVDIIECITFCTDYLTGLSGFNISANLLFIRIARTQMGTHIQKKKKRLGRRHNLDGKIWISIRCKCLTFFLFPQQNMYAVYWYITPILPTLPIRILGSLSVPYVLFILCASFTANEKHTRL